MNEATVGSREPLVEVRFGPVGLAQVRIRTTDPAVVETDLNGRVATAPKMFDRMAVALDLNELGRVPDSRAMRGVLDAVRRAGFVPVGFARGSEAVDTLARDLDMPVLMQFRTTRKAADARADEPSDALHLAGHVDTGPAHEAAGAERIRSAPGAVPVPKAGVPMTPAADSGPSLLHVQTVRSGQRVYARNRDLVVTATVGAGAEVMADGCVHVYGALRGRAMAGTRGDHAARVFCQEFHAELVSIAGVFRVFETIPPELAGQPVQAWLDGDDLKLAPIG